MLRRRDVADDRVLAERLERIFGDEAGTDDQPATAEYPSTSPAERSAWYLVIPRLDAPLRVRDLRGALGDRFTVLYVRTDKGIMSYIHASVGTFLQKFFEVRESAPRPFEYAAVARPRLLRKDHYFLDLYVADLPGLASRLPADTGVAYGIAVDLWLLKLLNSRKAAMEKKLFRARYEKTAAIPDLYEPLRRKLTDDLYLASLVVVADSKGRLKEAIEVVKAAASMPLRFSKKKVGPEKFFSLLEPPRISLAGRFAVGLGLAGFLTVSAKKLDELVVTPDPRVHSVPFVRAAAIPGRFTDSEGSIELGKLEDGGSFALSPDDLFRHAYIIGQTGTGKTNLLKLLARRLHSLGYPVFVIDPHGDLGVELATTVPDAIYLHPIRSPFGVNPLELPPIEDRDQAITISLDTLMNLFTNVFRLPETAVNVRYILQTVARQIYNVGGTPTLAGIYKIVMGIYNGADVGITDERFREQEKLLRNMPDQSFISTLGRLQSFAEDPILRRLTSSTTVDLDKFIDEGKMIIFSVPQPDVGLVASTLVCSTLLLKIYYTVLARARRGEKKDVFVIVDEFQTLQSLPILASILSEARKFGLHLIVAHQYAEQLSDEVFQAAMNNTGVKFVFQISGSDVHRFKTLDPAFGEEIARVATSLPTGRCLVKVTARPEDSQLPPFVVEILPDSAPQVRSIEEASTTEFEPEDVELDLTLVNPVLRYIDLPFPPKQKIIKALYELGGEATASELHGYVPYTRQDSFDKILNSMQAQGYVRIRKTNRGRVVSITEKFFEDFYKVAPSEKGKKLVRLAVLFYLQQGHYVAPVKSIPIPRPDLVVIPYREYFLDYRNAIEVEIEATTPEKMPEHITDTMRKGTPFKEKHVWCFEEDLPTVAEYLKFASPDKKITIFKVSGDRIQPLTPEEVLATLSSSGGEKVVEKERVRVDPDLSPPLDEEGGGDLLIRAFELLEEGLVYELDELGLLDDFVRIVDRCVDAVDEAMKARINEAAREIVEDPSKIDDLCSMLHGARLDEEAMATVAEAVRTNEKLRGREDVVDAMLELAKTAEGRELVKRIAELQLDADSTLRVLRIVQVSGSRYLDAIRKAKDVEKMLAFLEKRLGLPVESAGNGKEGAQLYTGKEESAESEQPESAETEHLAEAAETTRTKTSETEKKGKKKLSDIVIGSFGADARDIKEKKRDIVVINGRKLAVLKGDRRLLKMDADVYELYLVDERKTPVHDELPEHELLENATPLSDASPGIYTLLLVKDGKVVRKYIVEVLE